MLGGGGDEVGIMPIFTLVARLVSHHLVLFYLLVILLKILILTFLSIS